MLLAVEEKMEEKRWNTDISANDSSSKYEELEIWNFRFRLKHFYVRKKSK